MIENWINMAVLFCFLKSGFDEEKILECGRY